MPEKKSETIAAAQELEAIRSLKRQLIGEIRDRNPFVKDEEPDESRTKRYQELIQRYRRLLAHEEKEWGRIPNVLEPKH